MLYYMPMQKILLYYKFTPVQDPEVVKLWQKTLCDSLDLRGRILVSRHGLNGTVGGEIEDLKKYIKSFMSFMDVNDYPVSVNEGDNNISLYIKPGICRKYSLFWAEIIRMTLATIAEVTKVEVTESSMYFECRTGAK